MTALLTVLPNLFSAYLSLSYIYTTTYITHHCTHCSYAIVYAVVKLFSSCMCCLYSATLKRYLECQTLQPPLFKFLKICLAHSFCDTFFNNIVMKKSVVSASIQQGKKSPQWHYCLLVCSDFKMSLKKKNLYIQLNTRLQIFCQQTSMLTV